MSAITASISNPSAPVASKVRASGSCLLYCNAQLYSLSIYVFLAELQ